MSYEARIERDSITQYGERLTTFVVTFPRLVLAEFNTHRQFSRSSASSRAIPVEKQIARLKEDPFVPVYWGKSQKGMQADEELSPADTLRAKDAWDNDRDYAIAAAEHLLQIGVHKQITNRLLEPFMWHTVIVTATEWSNFFHLRDNKMAQPEIQKAAGMMSELYRASRPTLTNPDDWHLPFFKPEDTNWNHEPTIEKLIKVSVGRCARVSYLTHDGKRDLEADVALADSLLKNGHMAPWEHVARPMSDYERRIFGRARVFASVKPSARIDDKPLSIFTDVTPWEHGEREYFLGNFNGWVQARKLIHGEADILAFER
jgi:thymidylate synthase ThyX